MKWLKWVLGSLGALVLVLVLGGLLISPQFTVSRSATVNAPPAKVYALLQDPREWKRWTVWNQRDPAMAIEYSGPASGVGAAWAWKSATEGDGKMSFTAAEPARRLGYDLYFPDFGTTSQGDLTLDAQGAATRVTWVMHGNMGKNPLFRWLSFFTDKMVGPDFDAGLANLKKLAEAP